MRVSGGSLLQRHCQLLREAHGECKRRLATLESKHAQAVSAEEQANLQLRIDETTAVMVGLSSFYFEDGCSVEFGPIDSGTVATIPSVHGLPIPDASAVLARAGFEPVASARRFGATDSAEVVEGTLPPEGAAARVGSRIDLLPDLARRANEPSAPTPEEVSLGQGIMPDFKFWEPESVIRIVEAAGFRAWPRDTWSQDVEPGFVIFTEPRANTAVMTPVIVIWVSTGPPVIEPPPPPPPPDRPLEP